MDVRRDIMYELASMGDLPLPQPSPPAGHKRDRDEDDIESNTASTPSSQTMSSPTGSEESRHIAGSRRVSQHTHAQQHQHQQSHSQHSSVSQLPGVPTGNSMSAMAELGISNGHFTLPLHSDELGRLPLYPSGTTNPAFQTTNPTWPPEFAAFAATGASVNGPVAGSSTSVGPPPLSGVSLPPQMQQNGVPQAQPTQGQSQAPGFVPFSSVMYDSVLSNLSASLAPAASGAVQYPSSVDPQRQPLPTESFEQLMLALGSDSGMAMMPDMTGEGALSVWSNTPAGFE